MWSPLTSVPAGIIYSSVLSSDDDDRKWLELGINTLLSSLSSSEHAQVLWQLHYEQRCEAGPQSGVDDSGDTTNNGILYLPHSNETDLAFDDSLLQGVRAAWQRISGQVDGFMQFDASTSSLKDDED